jgi:hypothetical protein
MEIMLFEANAKLYFLMSYNWQYQYDRYPKLWEYNDEAVIHIHMHMHVDVMVPDVDT